MADSRLDAMRARAVGRRIARRTDRLPYFDGLRCLAVLSVVVVAAPVPLPAPTGQA
jgi:peptidoglycan/LPS O-acetylase OafA/YrhL